MGGDKDGDAVLLIDLTKLPPHVDSGGGVEAGARLVEQQDARAMQQSLGNFNPAAHPAAETFDAFTRPSFAQPGRALSAAVTRLAKILPRVDP